MKRITESFGRRFIPCWEYYALAALYASGCFGVDKVFVYGMASVLYVVTGLKHR